MMATVGSSDGSLRSTASPRTRRRNGQRTYRFIRTSRHNSWTGKSSIATSGSTRPRPALVGFRTTPPPLLERGRNVRRQATKGKGLPALRRLRFERKVGRFGTAYWISRTLSQRKSTSSALSQRKAAIGPPQVIGIAGALAPHALASPP